MHLFLDHVFDFPFKLMEFPQGAMKVKMINTGRKNNANQKHLLPDNKAVKP